MRDDFTQQTLDILAKRVGIRCSNPGCRKPATGPRSDSAQIINIGVGAHITAAAPGGPRFAPNLSGEERKSPDNGIWLCQSCAKLVDNDPERYTVEVLRNWKQRAEEAVLSEIEGVVSGRGSETDTSVSLEISYKRVKMLPERHDYLLETKLRNLGGEPLVAYHVDVELPARVIERAAENQFYVQERSNMTVSFFRATHQNGDQKNIFPGDTKTIVSIPYYVNRENSSNRRNLLDQIVRATLYRSGSRPLPVEKPFSELQFF